MLFRLGGLGDEDKHRKRGGGGDVLSAMRGRGAKATKTQIARGGGGRGLGGGKGSEWGGGRQGWCYGSPPPAAAVRRAGRASEIAGHKRAGRASDDCWSPPTAAVPRFMRINRRQTRGRAAARWARASAAVPCSAAPESNPSRIRVESESNLSRIRVESGSNPSRIRVPPREWAPPRRRPSDLSPHGVANRPVPFNLFLQPIGPGPHLRPRCESAAAKLHPHPHPLSP